MSEFADELVDAPTGDVDATVDAGAGEPDALVARADADETTPASAPSFDLNDPDVQAQLAGMSQQSALALLESLGLVSYNDDTPAAPDPLSDNYAQEHQAYLDAVLAKQLGPLHEYVQAQQAQQTNTMIGGAIRGAVEAAKVVDADEAIVRSLAGHFAADPQYARLGATEAGVKATAQAAAQWLAARDKASEDRGIQRYRQQIGEIQDTPAEPAGGATGGLAISQKPQTYDQIIEKHIGRFS